MSTELIKLKNSNPLYKYPTDAEKLNFNFEQLLNAGGTTAIKDIIEATGQVYLPSDPDQFFKAITQLIATAFMFKSVEQEPTSAYTLVPAYNGYTEPAKIMPGMRLSFVPSVTNTDAPTARFSTMLATYTYPIQKDNTVIQPNVLYPGTVYDMVFVQGDEALNTVDHWNIVSATSESGESDTAMMDTIFTQVRNLITAAGLAYSTTDFTLLTKAVAQFVGNSLYDCEYVPEENTYYLTAFGSIPPISSYTNGTLIAFMPSSANLASDPRIVINNLDKVILYNLKGASLAPGDVNTQAMVIARYLDGDFRIVNNNVSQLTLTSGPTVNEISNDSSLSSNSQSKLVTEQAIKAYVDLKVQSTQDNVILTGKTDEYGNADALHQFNTHCFEIITDTDSEGSYSYANITPAEPAKLSASNGVETTINAVANVQNIAEDPDTENPRLSTLYWECTRAANSSAPIGGFAIDGCKRVYNEATSTVERIPSNAEDSIENPYELMSGFTPSYYQLQLKDAGTLGTAADVFPGLLKIKHTRPDTTPKTIKFQVSFDNTAWYDVVDESSEFDNNHRDIHYKWTATETGTYYYTAAEYPSVKTPGISEDAYTLYLDPELTTASGYEVIAIIDGSSSNYTYTASNGTTTITCGGCEPIEVVVPIFEISYNYGDLENLTLDSDGYYTVAFPYAIWDRVADQNAKLYKDMSLTELLEEHDSLYVRILATYFPHQEYTPEQAAANYTVFAGELIVTDPDTHEETKYYTARTTWEIANLKLFKKINKVAPFSIAYPSKNLEILKKQLTYSVYQQKSRQISPEEIEYLNEVELLDLGATSTVVLYKEYMSENIMALPENLIYIQSYTPEPTALNDGALWFNPSTNENKVHICTQVEDTNVYVWNPIDCILLGKVTINRVTSGATFEDSILSDLISYRYGKLYTVHTPITQLTNQLITLHHNFGFDVTTDCYLKCIVPELGFAHGDYVSLAPGRFENTTLTPSTSTVTIDGTSYTFLTSATNISNNVSYFDVVDNAVDVLLRYSNLQVLNKNTNIYEPITANHWDLCVFINKD